MTAKLLPMTLAIIVCVTAHPTEQAGEKPAPGIKVGAQAPDVTFIDQFGKERTLKDLTKNGPVALVFHRSARW